MYNKYFEGAYINGIFFLKLTGTYSGNKRRGVFVCPYCGNKFETIVNNVGSGHTTSCGCNMVKKRSEKLIKHGHCIGGKHSSEYTSYKEMMDRCYNVKNEEYHNYAGRGIYVCDRWKDGFKNFIDDMGLKPGKDYSIERVDNNGIYEPTNCKWADDFEQANNTRRNKFLTFNGKTQTHAQWSRELNIPETTIKSRRQRGLTVEEILFTSPLKHYVA